MRITVVDYRRPGNECPVNYIGYSTSSENPFGMQNLYPDTVTRTKTNVFLPRLVLFGAPWYICLACYNISIAVEESITPPGVTKTVKSIIKYHIRKSSRWRRVSSFTQGPKKLYVIRHTAATAAPLKTKIRSAI